MCEACCQMINVIHPPPPSLHFVSCRALTPPGPSLSRYPRTTRTLAPPLNLGAAFFFYCSRPFTLEGTSDDPHGSITLGFTVVEDAAHSNSGDATRAEEGTRYTTDPRSVSGIFSTSDFSVDPPLPARSTTTRSEASLSEGGGGGRGRGGRGSGPRQDRSRNEDSGSRPRSDASSEEVRASMGSPAVPPRRAGGLRQDSQGGRTVEGGSGGRNSGSGSGGSEFSEEENGGRHGGDERASGLSMVEDSGSRCVHTREECRAPLSIRRNIGLCRFARLVSPCDRSSCGAVSVGKVVCHVFTFVGPT